MRCVKVESKIFTEIGMIVVPRRIGTKVLCSIVFEHIPRHMVPCWVDLGNQSGPNRLGCVSPCL
jgi:hypothetical protein